MLPRALRVAGWNHVWHTIMEHVCQTAWQWFPGWCTEFSGVAEYVSVTGHRECVDAWLRSVEDQLPEACAAEIRAIEDPQKRFEALQRALED